MEDEQGRQGWADDRTETEGRGDGGECVGALLAFGAGGDIGLHGRRRGRSPTTIDGAAEHEDDADDGRRQPDGKAGGEAGADAPHRDEEVGKRTRGERGGAYGR